MSVVAMRRRGIKAAGSSADWVNIAAGSALVVGGLLLFTRQRRAGVAVAAAGTALALVEHRESVRAWWHRIPGMLEQVQGAVAQVQARVSELAARRDSVIEAITSLGESQEMLRKED
ncbi:MAG TPA: hypothetical protein VE291_00755 [Terracidiphilus sp.]|jgi:hypothetical protein|nr:hypothetical protein [Terracidiphilus sp.]